MVAEGGWNAGGGGAAQALPPVTTEALQEQLGDMSAWLVSSQARRRSHLKRRGLLPQGAAGILQAAAATPRALGGTRRTCTPARPFPCPPQTRETSNLKYCPVHVPRERLPPPGAGYTLRSDWVLRGHTAACVTAVAQRDCVATSSFDGTCKLWRIPVGWAGWMGWWGWGRVLCGGGHAEPRQLAAPRPLGLLTGRGAPRVQEDAGDAQAARVLGPLATYADLAAPQMPGIGLPPINSMALSADLHLLASGSNDRQVAARPAALPAAAVPACCCARACRRRLCTRGLLTSARTHALAADQAVGCGVSRNHVPHGRPHGLGVVHDPHGRWAGWGTGQQTGLPAPQAWHPRARRPRPAPAEHTPLAPCPRAALARADDHSVLCTGGTDSTVRTWDCRAGGQVAVVDINTATPERAGDGRVASWVGAWGCGRLGLAHGEGR